MRDIKFRAKEVQTGKGLWRYGDYMSRFKDGSAYHYIVTHPNGRDAGREVIWEIDPETLGEWTGIADKSMADIYEADVLADRYNQKAVVIWDASSLEFRLINVKYFPSHEVHEDLDETQGWIALEIVGNIYDEASNDNRKKS